jgi:hypothetical protein
VNAERAKEKSFSPTIKIQQQWHIDLDHHYVASEQEKPQP